jgi:hypothetical protein
VNAADRVVPRLTGEEEKTIEGIQGDTMTIACRTKVGVIAMTTVKIGKDTIRRSVFV